MFDTNDIKPTTYEIDQGETLQIGDWVSISIDDVVTPFDLPAAFKVMNIMGNEYFITRYEYNKNMNIITSSDYMSFRRSILKKTNQPYWWNESIVQ